MIWIHEISQTALAAAVATLGLVILLELRSISRLRGSVDNHLTRVFEQLDLLRFESQQLLEAQERTPVRTERIYVNVPNPAPVAAPVPAAVAVAVAPPAPVNVVAAYQPSDTAGGGEARLLAALTAARARLGRADGAGAI
jgi:hypothetical protein